MNARAMFGAAVQAGVRDGSLIAEKAMRDDMGRVRQEISIQRLLEWAFASECAQVDFEDAGTLAAGYGYIGNAYRMAERGALGCRIDGGGRSYPDADADLVAAAVAVLPEGCGGRGMAVQIAELARARKVPDLLDGAVVQMGDLDPARLSGIVGCSPADIHRNRHGARAVKVALGVEPYIDGRKVKRWTVEICPVRYSVQHPGIARARRNYLQWRLALLDLRQTFVSYNNLSRWTLSSTLPPIAPWQNSV
ncbi:hypothetical protein GGR95_002950 [Sulfitobacter undariae]|uniref:Uncharacterized protein n=1 Tax=Sulfitobacter undariae TaxID=1563671 RepID=A0A7W6EB07_9RHOB|nr:hypothetical protein [Sulfitobacter undariae]MBB3995295.1 hypothetical protein [Sulfitobacter undariae]